MHHSDLVPFGLSNFRSAPFSTGPSVNGPDFLENTDWLDLCPCSKLRFRHLSQSACFLTRASCVLAHCFSKILHCCLNICKSASTCERSRLLKTRVLSGASESATWPLQRDPSCCP